MPQDIRPLNSLPVVWSDGQRNFLELANADNWAKYTNEFEQGEPIEVLYRIEGEFTLVSIGFDPKWSKDNESTLTIGQVRQWAMANDQDIFEYNAYELTDTEGVKWLLENNKLVPDDLAEVKKTFVTRSRSKSKAEPQTSQAAAKEIPAAWDLEHFPIRQFALAPLETGGEDIFEPLGDATPLLAQTFDEVYESWQERGKESKTEVYRLVDGRYLKLYEAYEIEQQRATRHFPQTLAYIDAKQVLKEFQRHKLWAVVPQEIIDEAAGKVAKPSPAESDSIAQAPLPIASEPEPQPPADSKSPATTKVAEANEADGPIPPNYFDRKGKRARLKPQGYKIVQALWGAVNKTLTSDDFIDEVWGEKMPEKPAVDTAISRTNDDLLRYGAGTTVSQKAGYVVLEFDN